MKCLIVTIFIYAVSSVGTCSNTNKLANRRAGEETWLSGEKWFWGSVDDSSSGGSVSPTSTTITTTTSETAPVKTKELHDSDYWANLIKRVKEEQAMKGCHEVYDPVKPNFNKPGRRLCEAKCEEYLWEEEKRRVLEQKDLMCFGRPVVVGGRPTFSGEFPHMAAVGWEAVVGEWIFKCGGSLISSKFVLTAAHCSRASELDTTLADLTPKIVRLNDLNLAKRDGTTALDEKIIRFINHPQYASPRKYFDIALIELEKDVVYTKYMRPACLWGRPDLSSFGPEATLTGWGVTRPGSLDTSPELLAADVDIIDQRQCDDLLQGLYNRNFKKLVDHQMCAGKLAGGVDACQGDSGGPLQYKKENVNSTVDYSVYIVGVTSLGKGCAQPDLPGIYIRVSSFIDWIEDIVWRQH